MEAHIPPFVCCLRVYIPPSVCCFVCGVWQSWLPVTDQMDVAMNAVATVSIEPSSRTPKQHAYCEALTQFRKELMKFAHKVGGTPDLNILSGKRCCLCALWASVQCISQVEVRL